MRHITEAGAAFIKGFEKLRLQAYMPTSDDVPTIGWGRTHGVKMGDTCTEQQANDWFALEDVAWAERCVERSILPDVVVTDAEFDALVSLCFNIGCPNFQGSTVLRLVNSGSEDEASIRRAFGLWDKQKGVVLGGLVKRRAAEVEMFLA